MSTSTGPGTRRLDRVDLATAGLFFSWLAHDLEEYLTMPGRPHPFTGHLPRWAGWPHTSGPDRGLRSAGRWRSARTPAAVPGPQTSGPSPQRRPWEHDHPTRTPAAVRVGQPLSRDQVYVALSLVGLLMAAASIDGYRTRGRSGFYQSMLFGYGMHAGIHLASAALTRGYTSGSATAVPVVLPFWLFARRALQADGVELRPRWWTLAAFPVLGLGVHGFGAWVARRWEKARS
ncbi:MAG: HXXEE domain-containing protein [Actinomycetia bacterium]|nr:HXXEE domain-containing protein [Actinomycetes bacterium]